MASAVELSEYDSISKELKELRSTCELQGKNFKEVIANDPALSMYLLLVEFVHHPHYLSASTPRTEGHSIQKIESQSTATPRTRKATKDTDQ